MRPILKANKIKYIISVLVFFPLSTASANTICDINTKTVLKWPGYASKQNVWYDKGDSFFKFSSTIKGKSMVMGKFIENLKVNGAIKIFYYKDKSINEAEMALPPKK